MKISNVQVAKLGIAKYDSPLKKIGTTFIEDSDNVISCIHKKEIFTSVLNQEVKFFEIAGPREKVFFNSDITCGIVTCGGLCPGINNVIRGIVIELFKCYGVKKILGFRYGYRGLAFPSQFSPLELNPDNVDDIHTRGGTILSSSRGKQNVEDILLTLLKYKIKILFTIGGDGTLRGASEIAKYIISKNFTS